MKQQTINHLRWGVILTYLTLFLNIILSIVYTPVMLRVLGQSEHGLYSTVSATMSWLSLLSLGFGSSYIRYYSKYKAIDDDDSIARLNGMFLLIFGIIGIVALICGVIISKNMHLVFGGGLSVDEYKTAEILSIIVTIDLAISFPASVFGSIIRANEKFIQVKLVNLFQCVTTPLITLPILYLGYGSVGMVAVTTTVDLAAYILNIVYCFKKMHIRVQFRNFEKGIFKDIAKFSSFIAINSIISQVNSSLDKMLLARYVNTSSVSVYAIGYSLYSYYSSFSSAVSSVFVPRIHKIVNESANKTILRQGLTSQFVKLGRIQFYIQMLLCTGILFFGQAFIRFWAGEGYANSYYVALLLCIAYTIPLCQRIGVEIQRAQNKHKVRTLVYAIMTTLNVIMTVILCQRYGEIGAVIGTAIAVVVIDVIFMNVYYHRYLNIDILCYWKNIIRISAGLAVPILIGICIMLWVDFTTLWMLIGCILGYSVVYVVSIWFLSMNDEEHALLLGPLLKITKRGKENVK